MRDLKADILFLIGRTTSPTCLEEQGHGLFCLSLCNGARLYAPAACKIMSKENNVVCIEYLGLKHKLEISPVVIRVKGKRILEAGAYIGNIVYSTHEKTAKILAF